MSLINMPIPLALADSLLAVLTRIAVALERSAGPEIKYEPPRQATLDDYSLCDPDTIADAQQAASDFGQRHMLVPGSPAYLSAIAEFESQVELAGGKEAVNELPWRIRTGVREDG